MSGSNVNASDDNIRRLENELAEKTTFANEIFSRAQNAERDLSDEERGLISETRGRVEKIKEQLETVESFTRAAHETRNRARQIGDAVQSMRTTAGTAPVEYRTAGAYMLDMYGSYLGKRDCQERLEMFERVASHQKTSDATGVIPDPIVGPVINFIDSARPIVAALGVKELPSESWHRPKVTQHTAVLVQGSTGAASDEKTELTSQKMTITRLNGTAVTYGGYVNVSKQSIDFSSPSVLDTVINDLAAQYAIQTEAATATAIAAASTTGSIGYADYHQDSVQHAVWSSAALAYTSTKGQGTLALFVAPDRLGVFGPLFAPYGPQNQFGQGFMANGFGQGPMGSISGVPVYMSAGLSAGQAFLVSSAAVEVYEQRVGSLQVVEPSLLGIQVAYAGYFTPMIIETGGIVPLIATGS
jgi:HK97 family phage major capsid protein